MLLLQLLPFTFFPWGLQFNMPLHQGLLMLRGLLLPPCSCRLKLPLWLLLHLQSGPCSPELPLATPRIRLLWLLGLPLTPGLLVLPLIPGLLVLALLVRLLTPSRLVVKLPLALPLRGWLSMLKGLPLRRDCSRLLMWHGKGAHRRCCNATHIQSTEQQTNKSFPTPLAEWHSKGLTGRGACNTFQANRRIDNTSCS